MNIEVPRIRLPQERDPRYQPHVLVVTEVGGEKEWEVEHPEACPRVCRWWPDARKVYEIERDVLGAGPPVDEFDCYVAWEVGNVGLDSLDVCLADHVEGIEVGPGLDGWRTLDPGRYVVDGWYEPFRWAGSEPCDADSGICVVGREGEV